jgi:hypothetical protein
LQLIGVQILQIPEFGEWKNIIKQNTKHCI